MYKKCSLSSKFTCRDLAGKVEACYRWTVELYDGRRFAPNFSVRKNLAA